MSASNHDLVVSTLISLEHQVTAVQQDVREVQTTLAGVNVSLGNLSGWLEKADAKLDNTAERLSAVEREVELRRGRGGNGTAPPLALYPPPLPAQKASVAPKSSRGGFALTLDHTALKVVVAAAATFAGTAASMRGCSQVRGPVPAMSAPHDVR